MASLYDLQTNLTKINCFIDDITSVRRFRSNFGDVFEKYDEEFAKDLRVIADNRNGFEAVLTKYTALKVKLQGQILVAKHISDEALANPDPRTEEIVVLAEEVEAQPVVATPAKKSKKSKR